MNLILRIIVNALALAAAVWFLPGMEIAGSDAIAASLGDTGSTVVAYLVIGALFGVVNALVRPLVELVALPLTCLTLGLFAVVINALMLLLTAWVSQFTPITLSFDGFLTALLAAIIVAIVSAVLGWVMPDRRAERSRED